MAHPFSKLFDKALRESTHSDNRVLTAAMGLLDKGYRREEVLEVLRKLHIGLIDDTEREIVADAIYELGGDEEAV